MCVVSVFCVLHRCSYLSVHVSRFISLSPSLSVLFCILCVSLVRARCLLVFALIRFPSFCPCLPHFPITCVDHLASLSAYLVLFSSLSCIWFCDSPSLCLLSLSPSLCLLIDFAGLLLSRFPSLLSFSRCASSYMCSNMCVVPNAAGLAGWLVIAMCTRRHHSMPAPRGRCMCLDFPNM